MLDYYVTYKVPYIHQTINYYKGRPMKQQWHRKKDMFLATQVTILSAMVLTKHRLLDNYKASAINSRFFFNQSRALYFIQTDVRFHYKIY